VDVEVQEVAQPIVKSEPPAHYPVPEHSVATYHGEEAGYGEEDYGAYEDESAYEGGVQLTDTTKGVGSEADLEAFFSIHAGQGEQAPGLATSVARLLSTQGTCASTLKPITSACL